jgi:hypothetical protein
MKHPFPLPSLAALRARFALAAAAALLSACGGGARIDEGPGPVAQPDPSPPSATLRITALGGSTDTVALGWAPLPGAGGFSIQREQAPGDWLTLAELPPESRDFIDQGLGAGQTYRYRVLARNTGQLLASAEATTPNQAAPTTAPGQLLGELARVVVGAPGGRVASADGRVVVEVPAGAFAAATDVVLHATTNTAPDGRGDGIELSLATTPAKPLQLTLARGAASGPGSSAGPADAADGLRVALQRGDGSWLALPTAVRTPQALTVALPLSAFTASPGAAGSTGALGASPLAAAPPARTRLGLYVDAYLKPASARLAAGAHRELVPYARTLQLEVDCGDTGDLCVPSPVLTPTEQPLRNDKAGYTRQWYVEGLPGGSTAVGQTATQVDVGAMYIAPNRTPSTNPVTVTFVSQNVKTGRTLALSAQIEVVEPRWTGTLRGQLGGGDDLAFGMSAEAVWTLAPGTALDSFTATGTQSIHVININCTATASPSGTALPPGALQIDRSTSPPTYTLDVGSLWDTVITGTCPGQPGQASVPMKVPGRLQVTGTVTGNGTRIEGRATLGGIDWDWALNSAL